MKKKLFFILIIALAWACSESKKDDNHAAETEKKVSGASIDIDEAGKENPPNEQLTIKSDNNINFYFTPSVDENLVREKGQQLLSFLENETNLKFQIHIPESYDQMIEDFGSGKADVGIMNSLSYVKARENFGVNAKLRVMRYGKSTYFGQIIANSSSGIEEINDLNGKIIAFTDPSSTSGYLFPQKILRQSGVTPAKTLFAGKHDDVVKMVYTGEVDAGATFYSEPTPEGVIRDARSRLIDQFPDVAEKVKVIAITEPIPNDPVVFSKAVPSDVSYKISLGLIQYMSTSAGKESMMALYSTEGFVRCSDSDYDILREALKE